MLGRKKRMTGKGDIPQFPKNNGVTKNRFQQSVYTSTVARKKASAVVTPRSVATEPVELRPQPTLASNPVPPSSTVRRCTFLTLP